MLPISGSELNRTTHIADVAIRGYYSAVDNMPSLFDQPKAVYISWKVITKYVI